MGKHQKFMNFDVLKNIFKEYPYIAATYLFGSRASGTAGPLSDVDIALLLKGNAPKGRDLIHEEDYLAYRIGNALHAKEVDVIDINGKGLVFQHTILKTGIVICDSDPSFRVQFESRVISHFCDFEPTLRYVEAYHSKGRLNRLARL